VHQARVEMLESNATQLRKEANFAKDALARSEARTKELQRELLAAREVSTQNRQVPSFNLRIHGW